MTEEDIGIVEKLDRELIERIRKNLLGNLIHYQQHRSYETDDCKQVVKFIREISDPIITEMVEALEQMVAEKCDYTLINKLGDPDEQHTVKFARRILAKVSGK